jgi:alpha-galactosidase
VYAQLEEFVADPPPFRLPGLDPRARYRVTEVRPEGESVPPVEASGLALASAGVAPPLRRPQSARILHAVRLG